MKRHLASTALSRLFAGETPQDEIERNVVHLAHCSKCRELAAAVAEELRKDGRLPEFVRGEPQGVFLALLEVEQKAARRRLLARAWWAERSDLSLAELDREFGKRPELRTAEMFEAILAEASALALEDPYAGEARALAAHTLARRFPDSQATSDDLRGEAMVVAANCRRLAGDWRGAAAALGEARTHLARGTGEPALEARLHSIQASLASDLGHLERAEEHLRRAARLFREAKLESAVASTALQEAGSLLAAGRHADAMERAEEALRSLTPCDTPLEILAQSLIIECLIALRFTSDALKTFLATLSLNEHAVSRRRELKVRYLEALLLDAFKFHRESEKALLYCARGYMEAELFKDAYLTMVTLVEILLRREAWDKAIAACEEAQEMMQEAGGACHSQLIEVWEQLLSLIESRRLQEIHLTDVRSFLSRHWNVPARGPLLPADIAAPPAPARSLPAAPAQETSVPMPPRPSGPSTDSLFCSLYTEAMERCERQLVSAALASCGGSRLEASRLLDVTPGTLRKKIRKYGIEIEDAASLPAEGKAPPLSEADRQALGLLRARTAWAEMSQFPVHRQLARIRHLSALQTREMFTNVIAAATSAAAEDPSRGEELAVIAQTIALALPSKEYPEALRNDLLAEVFLVAGNCRRLSCEWADSAAAFDRASEYLAAGTGASALKARLLSLQASLASDTGSLDDAQWSCPGFVDTLSFGGIRSPRCPEPVPPTVLSSGNRWWSWCERVAPPRSWRASSSRRLRRSATGSSRAAAG